MSTKIYNGFKFNIPKNKDKFSFIHKIRQELRAECLPIAKEILLKYVTETAIERHDELIILNNIGILNGENSILETVYKEFRTKYKNLQTGTREPDIDIEFNIAAIPYRNEIFGLFYTEQNTFIKILQSKPYFQDYSYWDNTDGPDNMTYRQWSSRGKKWDKIMPTSRPFDNCINLKIIDSDFYVTEYGYRPRYTDIQKNLDKYMKSKEERAKDFAIQRMVNEQNPYKKAPRDFNTEEFHKVMSLYSRIRYEVQEKNPKIMIRYKEIEKEIISLLPEITFEALEKIQIKPIIEDYQI